MACLQLWHARYFLTYFLQDIQLHTLQQRELPELNHPKIQEPIKSCLETANEFSS